MSDFRGMRETDRPALEAFLRQHASSAMFQLDHCLKGTGQFWLNDPVTDVVCLAPDGLALPIFTQEAVPGLARALAGQKIGGVVGTAASVEIFLASIALPTPTLDRVEGHYELDLANLQVPDTTGFSLAPYALVPRADLIAMRTEYYIEALDVAPESAATQALAHVEEGLETNRYRVLMKDDAPCGLTGFNTEVGEIVMIGGVHTPPAVRGQGYAGLALALHLAAAQERGIKRAVLSAASDAAARAYEKIGFQKMGAFRITILPQPVIING